MNDVAEMGLVVLISIVALVLPAAIIFLVFWYMHKQRQKMTEQWGVFAQQTGLSVTAGSWIQTPAVRGVYAGFNIWLRTESRGSGDSRTTYTVMTLQLPITNRLNLRFYKEGFLSKIGKAMGTQDLQVGDPLFDDAFMIKGNSPPHVANLLSPEVRQYALAMRDAMNVSLTQGQVGWEQIGSLLDPPRLSNVLNMLVMIARNVIAVEAPQMFEQMVAQQRQAPAQTPARVPQNPADRGAQPQTQQSKMAQCHNCNGKLEWDPLKTTGVVVCPYCGITTKVKLLLV